eukprot:tig00001065_g6707.t1
MYSYCYRDPAPRLPAPPPTTYPGTRYEAPVPRRPAVSLMTLRASRGFEFKAVFVMGLAEGTLPAAGAADDPALMAEERRLAYMAMTRAKERLVLSYAATAAKSHSPAAAGLRGEARVPVARSRFIDDLPGSVGVTRAGDRSRELEREQTLEELLENLPGADDDEPDARPASPAPPRIRPGSAALAGRRPPKGRTGSVTVVDGSGSSRVRSPAPRSPSPPPGRVPLPLTDAPSLNGASVRVRAGPASAAAAAAAAGAPGLVEGSEGAVEGEGGADKFFDPFDPEAELPDDAEIDALFEKEMAEKGNTDALDLLPELDEAELAAGLDDLDLDIDIDEILKSVTGVGEGLGLDDDLDSGEVPADTALLQKTIKELQEGGRAARADLALDADEEEEEELELELEIEEEEEEGGALLEGAGGGGLDIDVADLEGLGLDEDDEDGDLRTIRAGPKKRAVAQPLNSSRRGFRATDGDEDEEEEELDLELAEDDEAGLAPRGPAKGKAGARGRREVEAGEEEEDEDLALLDEAPKRGKKGAQRKPSRRSRFVAREKTPALPATFDFRTLAESGGRLHRPATRTPAQIAARRRVVHEQFGPGTVVGCGPSLDGNDLELKIEFDSGRRSRLLASVASLVRESSLGELPPAAIAEEGEHESAFAAARRAESAQRAKAAVGALPEPAVIAERALRAVGRRRRGGRGGEDELAGADLELLAMDSARDSVALSAPAPGSPPAPPPRPGPSSPPPAPPRPPAPRPRRGPGGAVDGAGGVGGAGDGAGLRGGPRPRQRPPGLHLPRRPPQGPRRLRLPPPRPAPPRQAPPPAPAPVPVQAPPPPAGRAKGKAKKSAGEAPADGAPKRRGRPPRA